MQPSWLSHTSHTWGKRHSEAKFRKALYKLCWPLNKAAALSFPSWSSFTPNSFTISNQLKECLLQLAQIITHKNWKPSVWKSYVCVLMAWVVWQNKSNFLLWLFRLYLHQKVLVQMWLVLHKAVEKCWLALKKRGKFRNRGLHGNWTFSCPLNTPAQREVSATLQRPPSLAWLDPP